MGRSSKKVKCFFHTVPRAIIGRLFAEFHCRSAYFIRRFFCPELPLPFRVVKWLAHNQRYKPLGVNVTESSRQNANAFDSYFSICNYGYSSL
jgi:hypothetical protein